MRSRRLVSVFSRWPGDPSSQKNREGEKQGRWQGQEQEQGEQGQVHLHLFNNRKGYQCGSARAFLHQAPPRASKQLEPTARAKKKSSPADGLLQGSGQEDELVKQCAPLASSRQVEPTACEHSLASKAQRCTCKVPLIADASSKNHVSSPNQIDPNTIRKMRFLWRHTSARRKWPGVSRKIASCAFHRATGLFPKLEN